MLTVTSIFASSLLLFNLFSVLNSFEIKFDNNHFSTSAHSRNDNSAISTTTILFDSLKRVSGLTLEGGKVEEACQYPEEVSNLKLDLIELAYRTNRGFTASTEDKRKATQIVEFLARWFKSVPSADDPARGYYDSYSNINRDKDIRSSNCISGKWTLIYTDAPDITSLDTTSNPLSTAKLGRIGQECDPPYIKNIIEWLSPEWSKGLPFSGESSILQKVVTVGSAVPSKPTIVNLKIGGLEIEASPDDSSGKSGNDLIESVRSRGLFAGILSVNPIDLKGPWNPPFGKFEILFLDDEMRIIRTGQKFLAVNLRIVNIEDEWF